MSYRYPGRIFAHLTCTRVQWVQDEDGNTLEDPVEEHGWIDRRWSPYVLFESRNDVSPEVDEDADSEDLADFVREALDWLEGGYEDNGDGTFYSADSYQPYDEPWDYSYALHFSRKYFGPQGWTEEPWHPVKNGNIEL